MEDPTAAVPPGHENLRAFWDQLDDAQRDRLLCEVREIDFDLIERLYQGRNDQHDLRDLLSRAKPPPAFRLDTARNRFTPEQARQRAERALREGLFGVILVAGGQGTRLGFDHPKGMFPLGPVSGRSLFQIHVEKILAATNRYDARIPLYLMTSPATHEETVRFFDEHDRFGLAEEDLNIFCQGTMPAVDEATGKVLLDRPDRVAASPDGHGGMLAALARSGMLDDMHRRGIRHLFYLQVDNPLVDICGPQFLGYHLLCDCEMSTQVIAKREPFEKVGNVVQVDGKLMVVEYSDLPDDVARRRRADGTLEIWAGSIAVHVLDLGLLGRAAESAEALPFHLAHKRVAYVDPSGRRIEPRRPNAIKFERFIFDLMPLAARAIVVEIDPDEGFAPLKNASGAEQDTAETAKAAMVAQHRRWLEAAGMEVAEGVAVEISPLWALDAAEVAEKIEPGMKVTEAMYFH
ncbi:MAG TPA: UDPGP type 1 family protein [Thermoguttaceae bacterium]|nr:UDPGP type 1 family protein [Thermoguttaceae bacterium]